MARSGKKNNLNETHFLVGRVYHNYISVLEEELAAGGLGRYRTAGVGNVLFALFERDDCIIKDLAQRVQLKPSTLTESLQRMKRAGLV